MLIFWNFCGVPLTYCVSARWLLLYPDRAGGGAPLAHSTAYTVFCFALLLAAYYVRDARAERRSNSLAGPDAAPPAAAGRPPAAARDPRPPRCDLVPVPLAGPAAATTRPRHDAPPPRRAPAPTHRDADPRDAPAATHPP